MRQLSGKVEKAWGYEDIWVTNDKYCSKFLHFTSGSKFSMHFHAEKEESWYVVSGKFIVHWIDTINARHYSQELKQGDKWHIPPLVPHRLECIETGVVLEVSTPDSVEDNYRVAPGDSQL